MLRNRLCKWEKLVFKIVMSHIIRIGVNWSINQKILDKKKEDGWRYNSNLRSTTVNGIGRADERWGQGGSLPQGLGCL